MIILSIKVLNHTYDKDSTFAEALSEDSQAQLFAGTKYHFASEKLKTC